MTLKHALLLSCSFTGAHHRCCGNISQRWNRKVYPVVAAEAKPQTTIEEITRSVKALGSIDGGIVVVGTPVMVIVRLS